MRAFVCALAMALGLAGGAQAQAWKTVGEIEGARHDIDLGSVKREGAHVASTMRMVPKKPQKTDGKTWVELRMQRLDDCANGVMTLVAVASYDARGAVVGRADGSDRPRTMDIKPGTAAAQYHDTVCAIDVRRAAMKPAVPLPEAGEISWTLLAHDEKAGTDHFSLDGAVIDAGEGTVLAIVRQDSLTAPPLASGEPYRSVVSAFAVDCQSGEYVILSSDYYDRHGQLIFTFTSPPETLKASKGAPTSAADVLWRNSCQPGVARAVGDRRQAAISTGTAWLGPKGYLVTASHVVEGASRFTLYQGGKPVGTAELVLNDPANDVAVLKPKLEGPPRRVLGLASGPAILGEPILSLGYPAPDVLGLSIKATAGEVNALAGASDNQRTDPRLLQISAQTHSGNSGGPVINRAGQVVGIVVTKMDLLAEDEPAQNVNYALKAGYVRNMLVELPDVGGHGGEWALVPGQNAAELLQGSVFLLVAEADAEEG
ncbi:S1C family serine protease [Phenylobacterium terrae]|uniref:S1C family serine protease n=1 Tax=Phenylobacterium terrae TaxID=2665495 RepID=A0ABW4MZV8_9CAUL